MSLNSQYFLFVFIASCGVLQLTAAFAHLRGLLFFRKTAIAYIIAILLIGGAFGWFFGWDNRLEEKIMHTGLEGRQQFLNFNLAALAALVFTVIVSSVANSRALIRPKEGVEAEQGLGSLKQMSYFKALVRSFRMTNWKEEAEQGLSNLKQTTTPRAIGHRLRTGKGKSEPDAGS